MQTSSVLNWLHIQHKHIIYDSPYTAQIFKIVNDVQTSCTHNFVIPYYKFGINKPRPVTFVQFLMAHFTSFISSTTFNFKFFYIYLSHKTFHSQKNLSILNSLTLLSNFLHMWSHTYWRNLYGTQIWYLESSLNI